jgi:hypothetical protein
MSLEKRLISFLIINIPLVILWVLLDISAIDFLLYYTIDLLMVSLVAAFLFLDTSTEPKEAKQSTTRSSFQVITQKPIGIGTGIIFSLFTLILLILTYGELRGVPFPVFLVAIYTIIIAVGLFAEKMSLQRAFADTVGSSGDLVKWGLFLVLTVAFLPVVTDLFTTKTIILGLLLFRFLFTMLGTIEVPSK